MQQHRPTKDIDGITAVAVDGIAAMASTAAVAA